MPLRPLLLLLAALLWAPVARAGDLTVFAAASLKTALDQVVGAYHAQGAGTVRVSYAGSSALARQIEQGAPADLFLSASSDWMDRLQQAGHIDPARRVNLLGNRLVLIGFGSQPPLALDRPGALTERLGSGRLAMALVDAVPAGIYGKAALEHMGLWAKLAPQVAQADNVRGALAFVASGAAPLGVVYATDAAAEPRVSVLAEFPADSHPPIVYPVAVVTGADPQAGAFLTYLRGTGAAALFQAQGFTLLGR